MLNETNNTLIGMFSVSLIMPVFADNPTPGGEWDYDFENSVVKQHESSLDLLVITTDVVSKGTMDRGSVDIYAIVTDPSGVITTHFTESYELEIGETRSIMFTPEINLEGDYLVKLSMRTTSLAHQYAN